MTISTKGGFFLIGGVMLFFDRAMLVIFPSCDGIPADMSNLGSPWETYEPPSSPESADPERRNLTTDLPDPLPHRPHHHHRTSENAPILRAETKGQGHSCIFRRADADPPEVDVYRLPC